jgi:hypothetical protein
MTRGRPFEPGNTFGRGRPKGSKNKSTSVVRRLLAEHHPMLMKSHVAAALKGDVRSRIWCLNDLNRGTLPGSKLKLPVIKVLPDIQRAQSIILKAVASLKCSALDAQAMFAMLAEIRKTIMDAIEVDRLVELERITKDFEKK